MIDTDSAEMLIDDIKSVLDELSDKMDDETHEGVIDDMHDIIDEIRSSGVDSKAMKSMVRDLQAAVNQFDKNNISKTKRHLKWVIKALEVY